MIYIAIDHINGEIDKPIDNILTEEQALKLKTSFGLIIIEINLFTGSVKEI